MPLVTPGVCRRREGLESLINLGDTPHADTDTGSNTDSPH
ncbi:hypothetical protein CCP4SC76_2020010 [Gammaproteobacteria bacterium]